LAFALASDSQERAWFKDNLMMEFNGGLTGFKGDSMGLSRDI
jgi:hypothetical protein